jgi:glycosyltransferase involved in cell wall biosynthesis
MNKTIRPVAVMCFSDGAGGMDMSAVRLASILSSVSEVTFVCKKGAFAESLYKNGNYAFECETVNFMSRTFSPSMLLRVKAILKKHRIANVIFLGASELKTLFFSFLGNSLNVIVWHGTTKSTPKHDVLHKLVYSCVNYHVAISNHLLRNMKTIVPETKGVHYRMIRPSFEIAVGDSGIEKPVHKEQINIAHVGRIAAGKGQIDAVLACQGLHKEGIRFKIYIIGEDNGNDYARQLLKTIKSLPYKDSIILTGFRNDVSKLLEQTDVFLFPSLGEGMPSVLIEALHTDSVCITYDNTVFPEFSDLGFHFHPVKTNDVEALTNKLTYVAQNMDSEAKKSEPNKALVQKIFQVERELSEWMEILQ